MAPSAMSPNGGANSAAYSNSESGTPGARSNASSSIAGDYTNLYSEAYTHGYTAGYIKGHDESESPRQMPIAIVGMSCRLPGNVTTPDEFWELCSRARTGWSEVPKERFENASFHHPNPGKGGCFNAIGGNFLKEDLGVFDAPFFNLTAQEAISMDPQQRILLECTFEALDSAGIPKHEIVGKNVGVFIGGSFSEYESQLFADAETTPMHQSTGCAFAMQSNRISHFFDLRGPSFTMDTACSSSLVALHQACQSLRNGESQSAIVGGCHLNMLPEVWISMAKSRLFSEEGRSFSFDNRGTGYGRGEGCGMVVLKPLDQALKDNDVIRSVIVGSGINQDGKTPGITMPNGSAQESLIRSVYKNAGIDPRDTGYVEAHGTGTKVGDPIEATALHNVFNEDRSARNPLFLGSVKSNIGHLEGASGIVAVIKTAMMLERGFILPNYDFKKPNDKIPFSKWNMKVPISQRPWPRPKRFASVNNFGYGGTNAHVVMERPPFLTLNEPSPESPDHIVQSTRLFVLSANDKSALETLMKNFGIYLEQRPEIFQNDLMSNVAYTLGQRRSPMQWRVAIQASSSFELIRSLNNGKITPAREKEPPRVGFVFTGQGAQWNAMGRELYEQYPVFASTLDACDRYLDSLGAPFSLISELQKDAETSLINEAHISQPACTAVQLALTDLLRSWGVFPTAVTGHSSGEIGAAYAAGILPLNSCMAISYYRGMVTMKLKKKFPQLRGAMMAVGGSKEEIAPLIADLAAKEVRIACFNSPTSLTISGDEPAIDELQALLEKKQIFNRKLQVDMAYHSHHMKLVADEYLEHIQSLDPPKSTQVKFHSSLYGNAIGGSKLEHHYWVENLTQSVRFSEALTNMCASANGFKTGVNMIVEIGPHSALAGPIKQILKSGGSNTMKIPYASVLVRNKHAVETALDLAATLFMRGANINLGAINLNQPGNRPSLLSDMPRYPWNHRTKYWHESRMMQKHKNRTVSRNDLLGTLAIYSNDLEPTWRNILRIDDLPWLRHHKIQTLTLFPMSGFISMAIEAASQRAISRSIKFDEIEIRNVFVSKPLVVTDEDVEMTLQLRPHQEARLRSSDVWDEFSIHSWAAGKGWTEHCKGIISVKKKDDNGDDSLQSTKNDIVSSVKASVNSNKLFTSLSELGVEYGPSFQGINGCEANEKCSTASIMTVDTLQEMPHAFQTPMIIHPAFLEQLIEMYWPVLNAGQGLKTIYLPSSIDRMTISREVTELTKAPGSSLKAFCHGTLPSSCIRTSQMSMFATTTIDSREAVIRLDDLTISPILERDVALESETRRELCYKLDWEPIFQEKAASDSHGASINGFSGYENGTSNGATNQEPNGICDFSWEEVVIVHGESESQRQLASKLSDDLEVLTARKPMTSTLLNASTKGKLCIVISELETSLLSSLDAAQFATLQNILTSVQGILWVVRGAYANSSNPDANMVTGLSRSIRSETLLKFATLDLDPNSILNSETAKSILQVFKSTFGPLDATNCELEFMERSGNLFTPRIINDSAMNEYVHKQIKGSGLEPTLFAQEGRPLQMVIGSPGSFETLHFTDQEVGQPLAGDEIEIEVKAIGMNPRDVSAAMGQTESSVFGSECSGVITTLGRNVANFNVGDRIAGISVSHGVYSTYTRINSAFALRFNDGMTFNDAASIPVAYSAAYYGLMDLGRLTKDDSILIHGATSAAGQAAVCLAQKVGAEIFATVSDAKRREYLIKEYGLQEDHIFSSNSTSFGRTLRQVPRFEVILDCVASSADTLRELWESLSNFGRFIELGQNASTRFETSGVESNKSFIAVNMMSLALERPQIMKRVVSSVSELFADGKIRPLTTTIFPISNVEAAFRVFQSGNFDGKLLVCPQAGDEVKANVSKHRNNILRPDATYILIGGTGGLGRSMARYMVSQGAKNLVLVSRSGSVTGKVKELTDELACLGATVVVRKCDVVNSDAVENLIQNELIGMPEIRGVIHGAMVLHDVLFEKMTFDQYHTVIESKVKGAWNFHNALKHKTLDFFVAISSAAGAVGNRGQAAYAAANTFLNAFVQHRVRLGLPASSIDLTAVSDAGYLAENLEAAAEVAKNLGSDTICEAEVLALLGAAINGRLASACNNHTITGMRITPTPPFWTSDAKFKHLRLAAEAAAAETAGSETAVTISFHAQLKAAKSLEEAQDVVCRGLLSILPSVLMLEEEDMDITRSLSNYALDSLVAIEVRNYITREFEANLQVLELLSSGSIETLAKAICLKSKLVSF